MSDDRDYAAEEMAAMDLYEVRQELEAERDKALKERDEALDWLEEALPLFRGADSPLVEAVEALLRKTGRLT